MPPKLDVPHVTARVECGDCPIRYRAVCARCDDGELDLLNRIKTYETYPAGKTILWAGESMRFLGSVVTGVATLSHTLEDGRRQMVGLLLPSDFVGRPGRSASPYDVTAVTDVTLCRFNRTEFEKIIGASPRIGGRLLEMTMDELDAARDWMLILGRKTAREKIASFLAILARRQLALSPGRSAGAVSFELPITREAIADYLGLTLETVSRQMTALRKDGVIEAPSLRRIVAPDFSALLAETGDDADGAAPA